MSTATMDAFGAFPFFGPAPAREQRRPQRRVNESTRELHRDQRGAVMFVGLCMSCFLIGALWFIIGIGDAIVFRDFMQEATDHATFTSAVFHAKGMNFISAINLIIMALIIVHIILGIIHDVLLLVCIFSLGFGCGAYLTARKIYTGYSKFMKPVAGALHVVEVAASYAYPLLAVYKGYTIGNDYGKFGPKAHKVNTVVLSPSLMPGGKLDAALNKAFTRKNAGDRTKTGNVTGTDSFTSTATSKKMLPVQGKKFADVCDTIAKNAVGGLLSIIPGNISSSEFFKQVIQPIISGAIKGRYCNDMKSPALNVGSDPMSAQLDKVQAKVDKQNADNAAKPVPQGGKAPDVIKGPDKSPGGASNPLSNAGGSLAQKAPGLASFFGISSDCLKDGSTIDPGFDKWWGCEGPLVPWTGTSNGSPWQEVWGLNIPFTSNYKDAQENKVALAGRKYNTVSDDERKMYFAEAEFYFDCKKDWADSSCNKDDNAAYSIQWKARMKRLEFPEVGALLASYAGQFLAALKLFKDIAGDFKDFFNIKDPMGNAIPTPLQQTSINSIIDGLLKNYVTKPLQQAGNAVGSMMNADGAYH